MALVTATVCVSLAPPVPVPCTRAVTVWSSGVVSPAMRKTSADRDRRRIEAVERHRRDGEAGRPGNRRGRGTDRGPLQTVLETDGAILQFNTSHCYVVSFG